MVWQGLQQSLQSVKRVAGVTRKESIVPMEAVTIKLGLFVVLSVFLFAVSWRSLRVAGSHGFYRFFAGEAIIGLILINGGEWFADPFAPLHVLSWILLFASLGLAIPGFIQLRNAGKPDGSRQDDALFEFEKTSTLVTSGLYGYIRHPLYGSLLVFAWGVFFKEISWTGVLLAAAASMCLIATAKADEKECIRHFGTAYEEYMGRTKMFVPWIL